MILEGAPVTGLTLLISTVSSTMVRGQYTRYRNMAFAPDTLAAPLTCFALAKRLLLQSIPIGPLGISAMDIFLAINLLYQFRTLERRWGSNTYMAFLFTSAVLGVCTVQLFVTESGSKQLSIDAVRILSAAGTIVPLAALLTCYLREVPSRSTLAMRIPGTNLIISEKALTLLPLMKLVLSPSTQLQAQTFRRAAVEADVGVWTRLWLALVGAIFAVMSTRSHVVRWWLTVFTRYICRPLLRFLRPLTDVLFGPSFTVDHAKPRNARHHQGGNGSFQLGIGGARAGFDGADDAGVVDGGRYVVESLTGGDTLQEVRARMRARRHGAQQQQGSRGGAVAAGAPAQARRRSPQEETARNEAIATIEAIGLRASRDEIIAALDMTGGNLEMAVQILLGN
ncbi:hypothetical protein, conserved [Leishmania donovani]|uniref:UBA/TS-N domain family protein n=1 Tax=Leishmania donovani TaxID=5661 RepID=E9BH27_LEIDO|nr:hypothetical protein, conserved [Leishmania donovani]TPP52290.1 UBA/TS-N domain family protein [Leishmania donovani]CBZ34553.1 hypothetical protein, conserved [Leishmania donovani]